MHNGHKTYSNLLGAAAKGASMGGVTTRGTMAVGAMTVAVAVSAPWCMASAG